MRRTRGQVGPSIANQNDSAVNRILGEELAAPILEFADLRRVHDANLAIGPIEPPLMGFRVVNTQGQTLNVAGWTIDLNGVQLGAAIPNLVTDTSTFKFDPGGRTC